MCGIIGILGRNPAAPLLIDGLKRLEYRGYDSAGVATLSDGEIHRRRAEGKIRNLEARVMQAPINGVVGIGHTRWATHGAPNEVNAHPHATDWVALVHNGIIENYRELRRELETAGRNAPFASDTDTEVVAHLITHYLSQGAAPEEAVADALRRIDGAFALAVIFAGRDDLMIGARRGSPLAVGWGDGEMFLGSDAMALAPLTKRLAYLEDGDMAVLRNDGAAIYDESGADADRPIRETALSGALIGKAGHRHFMHKEIHEQPAVIGDTLHSLLNAHEGRIALPEQPVDLAQVKRIAIVACGTAYYAGLVAKNWIETLARVGVEADVASEFRYREAPIDSDWMALFVSQSGETADTLAALRYAKDQGAGTLGVVNAPESSIAREASGVLPTLAGPEIGVASTKAFTTQLSALLAFAIALARARGALDADGEARLAASLAEAPARFAETLHYEEACQRVAPLLAEARDVLYLGRGLMYPIALEGALKLKEISYVHAEGYAAGEMKHGPIALIDENVPVVALAPSDRLFEKTASNVQEVRARGGKVILITDRDGANQIGELATETLILPDCDPIIAPILYSAPIQLLAYHAAVLKGTDVDQPRNLAKSVTVE